MYCRQSSATESGYPLQYGKAPIVYLITKAIMKNLLIFCLVIFYSCNHPSKDKIDTFIVPADTMPVYEGTNLKEPSPPSPNRAYYFPSNFIIDTAGLIFFYQQDRLLGMDDVVTKWDTPPQFINLKPKDIIQIPADNIEAFIKMNILNIDCKDRLVSIASTRDTIKSKGLSKIMAIFNKRPKCIRGWIFRKVTQEEEVVLDYKKRNAFYYRGDVKWDSTKILLPDFEMKTRN